MVTKADPIEEKAKPKPGSATSTLDKIKAKREARTGGKTKKPRGERTRRSVTGRSATTANGSQPAIEEAPTEFTTNEQQSKTSETIKGKRPKDTVDVAVETAKALATKDKKPAAGDGWDTDGEIDELEAAEVATEEAEEAQEEQEDDDRDDNLSEVQDGQKWSYAEDMPSIPTIEEAAINLARATKDEYIAANPALFAEPTFVEITPAIAAQLFQRRAPQQRGVSLPHVAFLSRQMKEGHWSFNGDTIRLNEAGELLDGQHRCLAIVDSGVTMHAVVVTVSNKSFETIDTGMRARSIGELFRMNGEPNWTKLAAALSCLAEVEAGRKPYAPAGGKARRSPLELQNLLEKHPHIRQSCSMLSKMPQSLGPLAMYACIHYLFSHCSEYEADQFFIDLNDGVGLHRTDPVYVLRERLMKDRMSRTAAAKFDKYSWFVYAWNARRRNETMTRIKSANIGEDPEII